MSEKQEMLNLLLVTDSLNQAEDWASSLRQKRYAIQETRADKLADVEREIAKHQIDLLIIADGLEDAKISDITHYIAEVGKDIPCLAVVSEADQTKGAALYKEAVQVIIASQETDWLVFAVERELASLRARRQVRKLEVALQESEKRERLLLAHSDKAIAYIHEGMHVSANSVYTTLFGYQDESELAGLPLLDMVVANEQAGLKTQFRIFSEAGGNDVLQLEMQCVREDGSEFLAQLALRHARFEGEACIQASWAPQLVEDNQEIVASAAAKVVNKEPKQEESKQTKQPVEASAQKERQEWKKRLQTALQTDDFKLLYQPIVGLHGVEQVMYEVLLRYVDGAGELKSSAEFGAVAKASGLMIDIDKWFVNRALDILAGETAAENMSFFIKLSEQMMSSAQDIAWLQTTLSEHKVAGSQLVFEIGEVFAMKHVDKVRPFIEALKQEGCRFCLADFGTDPDLSRSLHSLDVDFFKINGEFVRTMMSKKSSQKSVKTIAEMIKLGGKVGIAEQVEDAQSMAVLWGFGVDYAQGNYMQPPTDQMNYDFGDE